MKVKRLIEELQKYDPEAKVKLNGPCGEEVLFVLAAINYMTDSVWLETESDVDLSEELKARFEYAIDKQVDELEFYQELLEIGITIEHMKKYMSKEDAEHMEYFCKEHGLL